MMFILSGNDMKKRNIIKLLITAAMCVLLCAVVSACSGKSADNDPVNPPVPETPRPTPTPPTPTPSPTPLVLVEYYGDVEHLFFHEVIAYPELAFPNRTDAYTLDDYMITVNEFKAVLDNLHRKNFVLVSMHDVWEEFTSESGRQRMRRIEPLMLPEGKKPIVLSFDDLTFHLEPVNGFMHRYILGADGEIWAEGIDPAGNPIVTQDLTAITVLDKFIRENPGFSHNGAKGCIAQTGLHGILGYRTQTDSNDDSEAFRLNRAKEIARVKPVIERLNETGWYWASHTWGHIWIENASIGLIERDAERWNDEVASLIGDTIILIYSHGSRLDGNDVFRETAGPALSHYVNNLGFRMFASVGREPFWRARTDVPAVMMDRMAVDGITLRSVVATSAYERHLRFYDARDVFDPLRPNGPTNWGDE